MKELLVVEKPQIKLRNYLKKNLNMRAKIRVLGIDPGYDRLGISLIEEDTSSPQLIYSECFRTDKNKEETERLFLIGEKLKEILKKWQPDESALEKLFFATNQKTAIGVAKTVGIISYVLRGSNVPLYFYSPSEIKTAIVSHGRADKRDVHLMVSRLIELPQRKMLDDEVDSIAIALTHLAGRKYRRLRGE